MPSIRKLIGFASAIVRNQLFSMNSAGRFIVERKKRTNSSGNMPWTACGEPVWIASQAPMPANAIAM